jgi:hypothetical protein
MDFFVWEQNEGMDVPLWMGYPSLRLKNFQMLIVDYYHITHLFYNGNAIVYTFLLQ